MAVLKIACRKCGQKVSGDDSFYGGSFDVICYDPVSRLTIMIGASSYRGHLPFYQRFVPPLD